jgi:hypothetical protein
VRAWWWRMWFWREVREKARREGGGRWMRTRRWSSGGRQAKVVGIATEYCCAYQPVLWCFALLLMGWMSGMQSSTVGRDVSLGIRTSS